MRARFVFINLALAAVIAFLFFVGHSHIPLWSSDEGRYAEIAREMWETKSFIVPQFNYVTYLEKPILAPLTASLFMAVFGVTDFAARLPSILSALAYLLILFLFVRRLFGLMSARLSVLCLATSLGYVLVGRFAVIDMQMILMTSTAILLLMVGFFERSERYYLWSYLFMGLAFLTKGLLGIVLPASVFFTFLLWTRNLSELKHMHFKWGFVILGFVILPWLITIVLDEPEFLNDFIIKQHFGRFFSNSMGRTRPFWFYTYILPVASFPWFLFLPAATHFGFRQKNPDRDKIKFLLCWIVIPFILFSLSKGKLPYYIAPLCVPIAILAAYGLSAWLQNLLSKSQEGFFRYTWLVLAVLCLIACPIFLAVLAWVHEPELVLIKKTMLTGGFLLLSGGWLCWRMARLERKKMSLGILVSMTYMALLLVIHGMGVLSPLMSTIEFSNRLKPLLGSQDIVAVHASPDRFSDLPFHLGRRIVIVGPDRGTLEEESKEAEHAEDNAQWFLGANELFRLLEENKQHVFLLIRKKDWKNLQDRGFKSFPILFESHDRLLISNLSPASQKN